MRPDPLCNRFPSHSFQVVTTIFEMFKASNRPARGGTASITLHFDGSVSRGTSVSGCAAVLLFKLEEGKSFSKSISRPIGRCTVYEAELLGLIYGLQEALVCLNSKCIRHSFCSVNIGGPDRVIVRQLRGLSRVTDDNLKPLFVLVRALGSGFRKISVTQESNAWAHTLAVLARTTRAESVKYAIYRPNLTFLQRVRVQGEQTVATTNMPAGGKDPNNLIAMSFLRSLPNGEALFANMKCAGPLSLVLTDKTNMTVLGCVTLQLDVIWLNAPVQRALVEFFVVLSLPVPVHVSVLNSRVPDMLNRVRFPTHLA
ncbi:Ribonuclease H [Gracilaria domingensis]|nr:Ribonuclease H [Gracilaria domingensis]